jgi:cytochrome P450
LFSQGCKPTKVDPNLPSDTTSSSLTVTMFYLALNPAVYKKLQSILDSLFPNGDPDFVYSKSTSITYLDAVINESMRLQPAVSSTGGLTRITPTGGLMIAGVHVPGDVIVSVPPYTINRDPRYFDKAEEFIPERWTDEHPELVRDRGVLVPFSIGISHAAFPLV